MPKTEICQTCTWWEYIGGGLDNSIGRCHKYAPVPVNENTRTRWEFPLVRDEWCGDYVKKQTLLADNKNSPSAKTGNFLYKIISFFTRR